MDTEQLSVQYGTTREWLQEIIGEFLGTFLMVFLGNCGVAQTLLSDEGTPETTHIAYGFGYTVGILVAGGLSGAHINPAVTLAFVVIGKLHWRKMFHYFVGQYVGAFIAAVFTFAVYADCMTDIDGGRRRVIGPEANAAVFATFPEGHVRIGLIFLDQVFGTFILMLTICAVRDKRNMEVHTSLYALYIGLSVMIIGMSLGHISKYPLNPARDLSPRFFLIMAGWGLKPFTYRPIFWIPVLAPHVGAILGAITYVFLIEIHLPQEEEGNIESSEFSFVPTETVYSSP